jgi:hypothetical protein
MLKAKELDLRLKELEIQNKEYDQRHRPGAFRSSLTSPAVIAAIVAGWATLSAATLTWLSGQIGAESQREAARLQAAAAEKKFEADLVIEAAKTDYPDQAAQNLNFWLNSGLLSGELAARVRMYLEKRLPGEGLAKPGSAPIRVQEPSARYLPPAATRPASTRR